jgi:hypothetical protein
MSLLSLTGPLFERAGGRDFKNRGLKAAAAARLTAVDPSFFHPLTDHSLFLLRDAL